MSGTNRSIAIMVMGDMHAQSGPRIRVGIGGWTFAPWRDNFYPAGLPHDRELEYASRQLTSIEVNGTFSRTQGAATVGGFGAACGLAGLAVVACAPSASGGRDGGSWMTLAACMRV